MVKKSKPTPPYGRELAARLEFKNYPDFVFICMGGDAWNRAKAINARGGHSAAVVCPPDTSPCRYRWPVQECLVIIHWSTGPSVEQVMSLAVQLLEAHAATVAIFPAFEDHEVPVHFFDIDSQTWERTRNGVTLYKGKES